MKRLRLEAIRELLQVFCWLLGSFGIGNDPSQDMNASIRYWCDEVRFENADKSMIVMIEKSPVFVSNRMMRAMNHAPYHYVLVEKSHARIETMEGPKATVGGVRMMLGCRQLHHRVSLGKELSIVKYSQQRVIESWLVPERNLLMVGSKACRLISYFTFSDG